MVNSTQKYKILDKLEVVLNLPRYVAAPEISLEAKWSYRKSWSGTPKPKLSPYIIISVLRLYHAHLRQETWQLHDGSCPAIVAST